MDIVVNDFVAWILALPSIAWMYVAIETALDDKTMKFLFPHFDKKKPKWTVFRLAYLFFNMAAAILLPFGAFYCAEGGDGAIAGAVLIVLSVIMIAPTVALFIRGTILSRKAKREKAAKRAELKKKTDKILQKHVHVIIDRPLGSVHPEHDDIIYEVNYGYVQGVIGGDGEDQDVYVLGVYEPIDEFDGIVTAVIHRKNDVEDKWVVVPDGVVVTDDEIKRKTEFMEKYFDIEILR